MESQHFKMISLWFVWLETSGVGFRGVGQIAEGNKKMFSFGYNTKCTLY